jgi:ubiquinone/menaquinone biosynthesis C-methylase UbiE
MDHSQVVREGYDAIVERYLAMRPRDTADVLLLDKLIASVPKDGTVLDAGCGAGVPITELLVNHFDVTGVDFSEEQISRARQLVPRAQFLCADLRTVEFPAAYFDAICAYYSIIHIPRQDHAAVLKRFERFLRPGGVALLCLGAGDLPSDTVPDFLGAPMFWSHFDAKTSTRLVEQSGLAVEWTTLVEDTTSPGAGHLFVFARKPQGSSNVSEQT